MARSLRIEYPGAVYHVLNRGNYRKAVFGTEAAKEAFEACLFVACARYRWRLYAYCTLGNHYHFAVETLEANLSVGMQWLQSTFANRFNRAHQAHGHLFQGRFKSLIVERDAYLGPLIHYIHLNPWRARLARDAKPEAYRWSTLWYLHHKRTRSDFMDLGLGLYYAGGLADTPRGRRRYNAYLAWLKEDDQAKRQLQLALMNRGWALGCREFKEQLIERYAPVGERHGWGGRDFQEANRIRWETLVKAYMKALGRTEDEGRTHRKTAPWKVMIAHLMKERTSVGTIWLSERLNMGVPQGVSRSVRIFMQNNGPQAEEYKTMLRITT